MADYYYYINDDKNGPISFDELKVLAEQGTITPKTVIENDGLFATAERMDGLLSISMVTLAEQRSFSPEKIKQAISAVTKSLREKADTAKPIIVEKARTFWEFSKKQSVRLHQFTKNIVIPQAITLCRLGWEKFLSLPDRWRYGSIAALGLCLFALAYSTGCNKKETFTFDERAFRDARADGSVANMKSFLKKGRKVEIENRWKPINVNARDLSTGKTLLYLVVDNAKPGELNDRFNVVKYLIKKGANINVKDNNGRILLFTAFYRGNLEIVKYLIENGADIDAEGAYGDTPLHTVAKNDDFGMVKYLIEKGANIEAKTINGTPLHTAVRNNNLKMVKYLIEKGANIEAKTVDGETPLFCAERSVKRHDGIVEYLIAKGASTNTRDKLGRTPQAVREINAKEIAQREKENAERNRKPTSSAEMDLYLRRMGIPPKPQPVEVRIVP